MNPWRGRAIFALLLLCSITALGSSILAGVWMREKAWAITGADDSIRFRFDIGNAMNQGRGVIWQSMVESDLASTPERVLDLTPREFARGYLARYEQQYRQRQASGRPELDYPPLRLLVMSLWMKQVTSESGIASGYSDARALPLLRFNLAMELIATAGVVATITLLTRRAGRGVGASMLVGSIVAGLFFCNPAMFINSHAWPQWDVWVMPAFVWAIFLALLDRWTGAGLVIGLGALLKGQVLLILPGLLAWPLLRGNFSAPVRLLVGLLTSAAVMMSPWLLRHSIYLDLETRRLLNASETWWPLVWTLVTIALAWAGLAWRARWRGMSRAILIAITVVWIVIPFVRSAWIDQAKWPLLFALAVASFVIVRSNRYRWACVAGAIVGAMALASFRFDGSFAWWHVGFPTDRYKVMSMGPTLNAATLLGSGWRWNANDIVYESLTIRTLLKILAGTLMVVASIGVARADRRRSLWIVMGMVSWWCTLFAFMPQMHERYLIWAAASSAMLCVCGVVGVAFFIAISAISFEMTWYTMILANGAPGAWREWSQWLAPLHPGLSWSVVTIAIALVVASFAGRERRLRLGAERISSQQSL